jgi:hypothetical protein
MIVDMEKHHQRMNELLYKQIEFYYKLRSFQEKLSQLQEKKFFLATERKIETKTKYDQIVYF